MSSNLGSRLAKLQNKITARRHAGRVLRIVSRGVPDDVVEKFVEGEGFDPAEGDTIIHRVIVSPEELNGIQVPLQILSRSSNHGR